MAMYYNTPTPSEGFPAFNGIIREDGAWIPNDLANRDWAEYQEWLQVEGNVAQPYSEMPPPQPAPAPTEPSPAPADTTTTPPP